MPRRDKKSKLIDIILRKQFFDKRGIPSPVIRQKPIHFEYGGPIYEFGGASCDPNWIADGYCDPDCNYSGHDWDGGDCCPSTCMGGYGEMIPGEEPCGEYGYICHDPCTYDNITGGVCTCGDCPGIFGDNPIIDDYNPCCCDGTSVDNCEECATAVCGAVEGCTDPDACNYDINNTEDDGSCLYWDECGICGGSGILDGYCDCEGNVDLGCDCGEPGPSGCDNTCGSTLEFDECGVCDGPGICECCQDPWVGSCGESCACCEWQDDDGDGMHNVVDECIGTIDECGICGGSGILDGYCDCEGNVLDCHGDCNGSGVLDDCGVCDGDGMGGSCGGPPMSGCSSIDNEEDCLYGDADCIAWIPNCDCDGTLPDCAGICFGSTILDECGLCGGDNSTCLDCAGTPNGDNVVDNCGVCVSPENDSCVQGCNGFWYNDGTQPIEDQCGICGGNNLENSGNCDCVGNPNGSAYYDNCGTCVGTDTGYTPCTTDCFGYWGGDAIEDECGCCGGVGVNQDLDECGCGDNACGPHLILDGCGTCDGDGCSCITCGCDDNDTCSNDTAYTNGNSSCENGICSDCNYTETICYFGCGDTACLGNPCDGIDCSGECPLNNTCVDNVAYTNGNSSCENGICSDCNYDELSCPSGDNGSCCSADGTCGLKDCNQDCDGPAYLDNCDNCIVSSTDACPQDCNNEWGGDATEDGCGICSGGNSGHIANHDQDCNGDCFGEAVLDSCGVCSGGLSEHEADSDKDCNGECDGEAFVDNCEICSGGLSGHVADSDQDCGGECFGTTEIDECTVCGGDGIADGACDCQGNVEDECGICDGGGIPDDTCNCAGEMPETVCGGSYYTCGCECINDEDADGICDEVDDCVGVLDECGDCNGDGIDEGACDCNGNTFDECGVCNGDGGLVQCYDGSNACHATNQEDDYSFCPTPVFGCTASESCNYNAEATDDDGSCYTTDDTFPFDCSNDCTEDIDCADICNGSSVEDACGVCNGPGETVQCYDGSFVCNDADCPTPVWGCTDPTACNYDATATQDNGWCYYTHNNAEIYNCIPVGDGTSTQSSCVTDTDGDGICDQNDDCVSGFLDFCEICDGSCSDGDSDSCDVLDICNVCYGPGETVQCYDGSYVCTSGDCPGTTIDQDSYDLGNADGYADGYAVGTVDGAGSVNTPDFIKGGGGSHPISLSFRQYIGFTLPPKCGSRYDLDPCTSEHLMCANSTDGTSGSDSCGGLGEYASCGSGGKCVQYPIDYMMKTSAFNPVDDYPTNVYPTAYTPGDIIYTQQYSDTTQGADSFQAFVSFSNFFTPEASFYDASGTVIEFEPGKGYWLEAINDMWLWWQQPYQGGSE